MQGYEEIARTRNEYGLFVLWESQKYGDEAPAKVTRNGVVIGSTFDNLFQFLDEEGFLTL